MFPNYLKMIFYGFYFKNPYSFDVPILFFLVNFAK